jgi:IS30 family transposase
LYNWIEGGPMKVKNGDLLLKVRRKQPTKVKEQKRRYGKSIDERSEKANTREEFGHWEGDSIIGKDRRGHVITLLERKRRVGLMFKFDKMRAKNMVTVLRILQGRYRKQFREIFKSITFDNGSEFAYNKEMSRYTKVYYAHAYRSCERASNENFNGIVRRFIPKGSDITALSQDDIDRINHWINTLPRRLLGYKTALEMFRQETDKLSAQPAA